MKKSIAVIAIGAVLGLAAPGDSEAGTVTRQTGDRIRVKGTNLSVRPGPGRAGTPFAVVRSGGSVYVLPGDKLTQVRDGSVDRRRFEVAALAHARTGKVAPPPAAETYRLTLRYLDRNGAPTQEAFAAVTGWDTDTSDWPAVSPDGTSTVELPKGRYNLGAYLGSGPDLALLVQPVVNLTGDLTITLDARTARPVTVSVPEPTARAGFVDAGFSIYPSYQSWPTGMLLVGDAASGVRMGQLGDPAPSEAMVGSVAAQWAKPDGAGDFKDSPYLYAVAETFPGRLPNGFTRAYRSGDFGAVRQQFVASAPGQTAERDVWPFFEPRPGGFSALAVPTTLPSSRVEYHQVGVRWTGDLWTDKRLYRKPTAYLPARTYRDQWNAGPTGPAFGQASSVASRTGDRIDVTLPLYGDRAGHAGSLAPTDTARTALYRDGKLVDEFARSGRGSFTVPPGPAGYRLEVDDTRGTEELTTRLSAAWTFRSGHADGTDPVRLATVRFTPAPDAPAGRIFTLPVSVEGQSRTTALTVDISYDDGATWSSATVRRARTGWTATVRHPAGAGFASLRATATDVTGTAVTETIIRAYRLTTR